MRSPELGHALDLAQVALTADSAPDDLRKAIYFLSRYNGQYKGLVAEIRAKLVIGQIPIVAQVRKSTNTEDWEEKIDFWVHFQQGIHATVPIQVKSSDRLLKKFRYWAVRNGRSIIGLNCALEIPETQIVANFYQELHNLDIRP